MYPLTHPRAPLRAWALLALALLGLLASLAAAAQSSAAPSARSAIDAALDHKAASESQFLSPDEAFKVHAEAAGADAVRLTWQIAPGYYLYRDRLKITSSAANAQLGVPVLPVGQSKTDEYFGTQQVYHEELVATLPIARAPGSAALELPVSVTYQGCAEAGLCYPPVNKTLTVSLPPASGPGAPIAATAAAPGAAVGAGFVSAQDRYASIIRDGSLLWVIGFFFVAGLVLAFTPCVLPMVPIVSGIIVGHGDKVTTGRAFALSLTYVLGMAATYTAAGVAVAAGGQHVQAAFQQPWIIVLFAALFVVLAAAMFGLFTLQMPASLQTRLASLSNRQAAGTFGGVALMGMLSALIVTTCVAPALVGALIFIGQSGKIVRGGVALFSMGLGMGAPLLVVGASAGKLLPKAGPWMDMVKKLVGAMMLAVAAWMLARIVPERLALILWAVPALAAALVLWSGAGSLRRSTWPVRLAGAAAGLYACALLVGAALGATDPLAPLPQLASNRHELAFRTIKSVSDLDRAVAQAKAAGRPVMLDFYADWCVSCKEMAKYTFTDPKVQSALDRAV
ncbi:MAG: protein-disulfide reductase DsbD, partial [Methylobacteriaceae bacterium]|nr:protein-disulfide reductase DsbD [Methylobacteriaceae bacterium]